MGAARPRTRLPEAHDLAASHPDKLAALQHEFDEVAARNKVLPINPDFASRAHPNPPPPGGRAFYTFYAGTTHLFDATAPGTRNRTHTFTIDPRSPKAPLMMVCWLPTAVSHRATRSGVKDGRPSYTYNYFGARSPPSLRRNGSRLATRVSSCTSPTKAAEPGSPRRPRCASTACRLARHISRRLCRTSTATTRPSDVGEDTATPVGPYTAPFPFTGTIQKWNQN